MQHLRGGRSNRLRSFSLALVLMLLTCGVSAFGQTYRGGIHGTVTDASGAAVPSATVTAVETSTNFAYKTVASSTGEFDFSSLPLGTYTVTIAAPSFSTEKYDKVTIEAGVTYTLPAKLSASNVTQTVEVTAAQLTLDTSTDTQGTVLPSVVVQNLPNSGRDFTQMLAQTPGFAGFSTGGGAGAASVNGMRSNSVNWQIDGTDNNDLWWNIPAVNQGGVSAIAGVVLPLDAIENFAFVTSGDITLGRNPGGTVNITLKSGSNHLHGSAYYYNHNEFFEKLNPFESSKSASRLQNYGFSVGGPIIKDKFFFFLSGEHQNFLIGAENNPTEPGTQYQALAEAVLSNYGVPVNQVSLNLLNGNGTTPGLWPASAVSSTLAATPNNYAAPGSLTGHSFNGVAKLDTNITPKDHLSASWTVGQGTQTAPSGSDLAPYFENAPIHVQNYSVIYNRYITPHIANQGAIGVSYFNQVFSDHDISFDPLALGLNTGVSGAALAGSPELIITPSSTASVGLSASNTGFDEIGPTPLSGRNDITGHFDDDLSWTKGAHQMHFGGEIRQAQVDDFYQVGQRGKILFDGSQGPWSATGGSAACDALADQGTGRGNPKPQTSGPAGNVTALADFLAGCYDPADTTIVLGNPKRQVFVNTFAIYGADVYQVSKKLSLNFGLRYDYEGPIHSHYPNLSVFDPSQPSGLAIAGKDVPNLYNKFWGAVSPRVGFAWQMDNTGKTVLHAGYGFYYDTFFVKSFLENNGLTNISVFGAGLNPIGSNIVADANANSAVIQSGVDIFPTLAEATTGTPSPGSVNLSTFDKNLKPSDTQSWDLNIQHSITPSIVAQIGYVGTKGTHLLGMADINPSAPNTTGGPINSTRPYYAQFPQFGVIDEARSNLGSIYHSLQTTLKLQGWHGLTSQLAYTWSHALDYETGLLPYLPEDPTNEKLEYGNSDYDVRNTFTGLVDYAIPAFAGPKRLTHGWELNSGFSFHGGTPYTVDASGNLSGNGDFADRAVQIGNPKAGISHAISGGSVQWFNPAAFTDPAPGTYSLTRRGQNYNPGYSAVDLAVLKTTPVAEGISIQFQAQLFNIFNHTNLAPVGFPSTGDGGTIGSTIGPYLGNPGIGPGEPLNVDFALKVLF
jgi:hypothetical protein